MAKTGLYSNIHAKRKRIASGSGESMRQPGTKGAPTNKDFIKSAKTAKMKTGGSTPAWTRSEGKNPTGGLNAKGVASYRAANPGSKLKMAVTTKPSKIKAGSKDAKRRKSFCARSAGQMANFPKAAKDPNSRLRLARKKWNC